MRKVFIYTMISFTIVLLAISSSYATQVIGTMNATVTSIRGPEAEADWNLGDPISITFLFDDAGTEFTQFNDGQNGIGEFGENDDTIKEIFPPNSDWLYASDADVSLPPTFADYADDYNLYFVNASYVFSSSTYDLGLRLYADGLNILINDVSDSSSNNFHRIEWGGVPDFLGNLENDIGLDNSTFSYTPVPVPATMILFGTGLIGLVGLRKKKFKK